MKMTAPPGGRADKLWGPDFIAAFGSLYTAYRPGCWWYEFVIMARKITLVCRSPHTILNRIF